MSKNQLIALVGKSNTGKTTTIKKVSEILKNTAGATEILETYEELGASKNDFFVIFEINGIRVGICSRGDISLSLEKDLKKFLENKCTVILCPVRTWGGTQEKCEEFCRSNSFENKKIKQTNIRNLKSYGLDEAPETVGLRDCSNARTAGHIVRLLLKITSELSASKRGV